MDYKKYGWAIILLAVVVMAVGSLVMARPGKLYVSPDETANAFFIDAFADSGKLYVFESLNVAFNDLIHPRSVLSVDARLVPAGFLGLPVLYGTLSLIGAWIIPLLTPILAAIAVFAWYGIVRRIFDRDTARLSAVLLALHPAWWYYTARGLMPNVPFLSLLLIGVWFLVVRPIRAAQERMSRLDLVFGGVAIGLAVFIRPSEVVWIAIAGLFVAAYYRRAVSVKDIVLVVLSACLALAPLPFLNRDLYGNAFATGYTAGGESGDPDPLLSTPQPIEPEPIIAEDAPEWWGSFQGIIEPILPFGFHPRNLARAVTWYALGLFWWLTLLTIIGFPMAAATKGLAKEYKQSRRAYLIAGGLATGWLFLLYGSWVIHDNPDPSTVSIANSYIRYWLPFFVWTTPFVAGAIHWVSRRAITPLARTVATVAIVLLIAGLNIRAVFFAPEDGLVHAAEVMERSKEIQTRVLQRTEDSAVIIVDRADKLFFPHRAVRYPLRDEVTYALMPRIVLQAPLYYYGITFPQTDLDYLNNEKLKAMDLRIQLVETFDAESLYQITPAP